MGTREEADELPYGGSVTCNMGVSLGHLREQDGASCERRSGSPGDKGERFRKRVSASGLEHTELGVLHADLQSGRAVPSATVSGRDILKEVSDGTQFPCERRLRQLSLMVGRPTGGRGGGRKEVCGLAKEQSE